MGAGTHPLDRAGRVASDGAAGRRAGPPLQLGDPIRHRPGFDGALSAAGKGLADILWRVVCAGETLPVAEKALTWPSRSGKLVLKLALDRVADFYCLP